MTKMPNFRDILKKHFIIGIGNPDGYYDFDAAAREYGIAVRNTTLAWAASNAECHKKALMRMLILEGETSKELEI